MPLTVTPFKLNVGSPTMPGLDDREFKTLAQLRNAAEKVLRDFEPRVRRWNPDGLSVLHDAILAIQSITDLPAARPFDVVLDADSGTAIRIILFTT